MATANSILGVDLVRMGRNGQLSKLEGRPMTDPSELEEANFFLEHGETRHQKHVRMTALREERHRAEQIADLNGPPPDVFEAKGLSPKRADFARYFYWRLREAKSLSELMAKRRDLEAMISAPEAHEANYQTSVRRTADWLLGRADKAGEDNARGLADALAVANHRADAARVALAEVDAQIGRAQLRVARLNERESEFLAPAIIEVADHVGLTALYRRKIAELRAVAELVFGLSSSFGGYGSGLQSGQEIRFPQMHITADRQATPSDYAIGASGNEQPWRALAQALLLDPRHDVRRFVALPK